MRFLLHLGLMVLIALSVGFGLSWYALTDGRLVGAIAVGPWTAWRDVGAADPTPYARAYIARNGGLQLGSGEGIQFIATTDSDNRKLVRNCNYRLDGTTPPARLWTLIPSAPDGSPIARPDGQILFESTRLARAADGSVELHVGKALAPMNWLEITGDGPFQLVLNLYDSQNLSGAGPDVSALPAITLEACT